MHQAFRIIRECDRGTAAGFDLLKESAGWCVWYLCESKKREIIL